MKMKFEFGDYKVKLFSEDLLKDFRNNNVFDDMISKNKYDFFNKMYENIPESMMNYYKGLYKSYEAYMNFIKAGVGYMANCPNHMPANGHDIYNYVSRYGLSSCQIQAIMRLDGFLDFDKLTEAVKLSIEEQPVFSSRFVENEPPYWKRMSNINMNLICSLMETDNLDEDIQTFLDSPLDMDNDPMVKVKLMRTGEFDTVCIKLNHACCDGTGTKEYIQLLTDIYSCIDQEFGIYIPKPKKRSRRDQDKLFRELKIKNPDAEWIPGSEITRATWPFPWKQVRKDISHVIVSKLPQEVYSDMTAFSKKSGVKLNDYILTSYYRALSSMGNPVYGEPMDIPITIDLRRYLPDNKTEVIRNFSGSEVASIPLVPDEPFSETLLRVVPMMNKLKISRPGLQSAIGLERVEKLPFHETLTYYKNISQWSSYCTDKCAPVLSNLGIISNQLIKFGSRSVVDACIIPPVARAPGILLMVGTYNGIVTLSIGYYEGSILKEDAERLINKIKEELTDGCRQIDK